MEAETRNLLIERYAASNRSLSEITGLDLAHLIS